MKIIVLVVTLRSRDGVSTLPQSLIFLEREFDFVVMKLAVLSSG